MDSYMATLTLTRETSGIMRKVRVKFSTSLYDLSTYLFTSLVKREDREAYSFLFRFDDVVYLTKKEEQESFYGYSDGTYHLLDEEKFINVVLKNPKTLSFELEDNSGEGNLVFDIMVSDIQMASGEEDIVFLSGRNRILKNRKEESVTLSSPDIKDWKQVKKENRYHPN